MHGRACALQHMRNSSPAAYPHSARSRDVIPVDECAVHPTRNTALVAPSVPPVQLASSPETRALRVDARLAGRKVLVVDDSSSNLRFACFILSRLGGEWWCAVYTLGRPLLYDYNAIEAALLARLL